MSAVILNLLRWRKQSQQIAPPPCERCLEEAPAHYRVKTDLLDILVCDECAALAWKMGLPTKRLAVALRMPKFVVSGNCKLTHLRRK